MIKVVNVISDTNVGGAGKCLINFCKNFDKQKFDVSVVLPKESELIKYLDGNGVNIIEIDGLKDQSMDIGALYTLIKILKKEQPDIVHTHSSFTARIAAKFVKDCRIVYTRHSVFPLSVWQKSVLGKWFNKTVNEFFSDRIIAVAEAAKENLTDGGISEEKIDVILNGVDKVKILPVEEKQALRKKLAIKDDERLVGIIARVEKVKGHEYFLEAAKRVIDSGKVNVKFAIIGDGSELENLKSKAKELGIEKKVIFTGFVDNVSDYLNILDLQVNCSYGTEATSLSLLEGMSIGVPAVVSNYGGNPGVIENGENGYIVPMKSPKDIADAMIRILTNDELRKYMNQKCIEIYDNKFTVEKYTKNIERTYESMNAEPQVKKVNVLDIFIILFVLIACIFGYGYVNKTQTVIAPKNTTKVIYQIRTTESVPAVYDLIEENTVLYDSTKNMLLGTVTAKEKLASERYDFDHKKGEFHKNELPEDKAIDILLTIEADANMTENHILVGDYSIQVGSQVFIKGKGFAGTGYITSIER